MRVNPVIEKELKIKMRGWKSPALITAYLGFLGLVVLLIFLSNNLLLGYNTGSFNPRTALNAYNTLAILQFFLLMFIIPAMTGGSISGERERQTLDLLLCTNISPLSIILGKVSASIAHIMLLITASLPIMGTVFLFGGIRLEELLLLFSFLLATALLLGSMGTFYSTVFKRSTVSIVMTYITIGVLVGGTVILFGLFTALVYSPAGRQPTMTDMMAFMFSNPLFGFSSVLEGTNTNIIFIDIFYRIGSMGTNPGFAGLSIAPWMVNMAFDVVAAAIFILLAAWRIKPVKRSLFKRLLSRRPLLKKPTI
jgi:ABC-type transport system involved in multi-copper enzyme maturation permease subunit